MRPIHRLVSQPLNWLPVGRVKDAHEWDLRVGGGDSRAGWLRWARLYAGEARSSEACYRFERHGVWDHRVRVSGLPDGEAVFRYKRTVEWLPPWLNWDGTGRLDLPLCERSYWWYQVDEPVLEQRTHWVWALRYGHPIIHVIHHRQLLRDRRSANLEELARVPGRVEIEDAATGAPELDLLVLLGWFLRLTAAFGRVDY